MAILRQKEKSLWSTLGGLVPGNVYAVFWLCIMWWLFVHGDLLRHTWKVVGPIILKSGIMEGPFISDYMNGINLGDDS